MAGEQDNGWMDDATQASSNGNVPQGPATRYDERFYGNDMPTERRNAVTRPNLKSANPDRVVATDELFGR